MTGQFCMVKVTIATTNKFHVLAETCAMDNQIKPHYEDFIHVCGTWININMGMIPTGLQVTDSKVKVITWSYWSYLHYVQWKTGECFTPKEFRVDLVRDLISLWKKKNRPIAGCVIEPIQAEGGDNFATPYFFQELQKICIENDVALLIDEVQTGCGSTGKFWAHEHFNLPEAPDLVAFSKKMLTGGFYYKDHYRPQEAYRIFNTWVGDSSKVLMLEEVVKTIKQYDLLTNVQNTGVYLQAGLARMETQFPNILSSVRGLGTFCAVDFPNSATRDKVISKLREKGVHTGPCGDISMRFRPSLIFQNHHADIFFEAFESVLKDVSQ